MRKGYQGPLAKSGNTPPPKFTYSPPPDKGLNIIHQDDDILVLSKPSNLLTVLGKDIGMEDSLETRAQKQFPTARVVHRLDRGTSGIFIMALNDKSHRHLGLQFEKRQTAKTYIAKVTGLMRPETGRIELPLRTDWYNRPKQMVDTYFGREAITCWKVLNHFEDMSLVELYPETGRSHQLRVHLMELGFPILGDTFYNHEVPNRSQERMLLHAQTLEVFHPANGERVTFTDPCDFI